MGGRGMVGVRDEPKNRNIKGAPEVTGGGVRGWARHWTWPPQKKTWEEAEEQLTGTGPYVVYIYRNRPHLRKRGP